MTGKGKTQSSCERPICITGISLAGFFPALLIAISGALGIIVSHAVVLALMSLNHDIFAIQHRFAQP
jgi:hypothetical protein